MFNTKFLGLLITASTLLQVSAGPDKKQYFTFIKPSDWNRQNPNRFRFPNDPLPLGKPLRKSTIAIFISDQYIQASHVYIYLCTK